MVKPSSPILKTCIGRSFRMFGTHCHFKWGKACEAKIRTRNGTSRTHYQDREREEHLWHQIHARRWEPYSWRWKGIQAFLKISSWCFQSRKSNWRNQRVYLNGGWTWFCEHNTQARRWGGSQRLLWCWSPASVKALRIPIRCGRRRVDIWLTKATTSIKSIEW